MKRSDKIIFVLTLLAALLAIQPLLERHADIGFEVATFHFTIGILYYGVGLLLGLSVYCFGILFVTDRGSSWVTRIADLFYTAALICIPIYFALWFIIWLAGNLPDGLHKATIEGFLNLGASFVSLVALLVSTFQVSRRIFVKEAEANALRYSGQEISHLERGAQMFVAGYFDLAVVESFRAIEAALKRLLASKNIFSDYQRPVELIEMAFRRELIPASVAESINVIRRMRNDAAHSTRPLSREDAEKCLALTKEILATFGAGD